MSRRFPIRHTLAAFGAGVMLLGVASACGSDDDDLRPSAYGPTVTGHATCAWVVSSDECKNSGVPEQYWYQMPQQQPAQYYPDHHDDLISQLFLWHLMYHAWFASPGYYNYYVPSSYRTTYVHNYVTVFDNRYSSQEHTAERNATYKTSSGKTVRGDQANSKRFTGKNNGGSRSNTNGGCNAFTLPLNSDDGTNSIVLARGGGGRSGGGGSHGGGSGSRGRSGNSGGDRGNGGTSHRGC